MIEENEQLPETWIKAKVGDLADIVSPGFPYGQYNIEGKGLPHLRPMNIDGQGRLCLDEIKYVDVVDPPLLQRNDILFNNTNSPVWVGKTTTIPESNKFTFSNHMTLLRVKKSIGEAKFFALQLQHLQQQGYFLTRCTNHVNQASISSTYLARNVELVIAPLSEQQRIVETIEQQFSRLDAGIASLRSAQKKLKLYRASVLKAAVEGELTAEWSAANPPTEPASVLLERILKERRELWEEEQRAKGKDPKKIKYVEPAEPNVNNFPELPEEWCWATVEQVSQRVKYGTSAKTSGDSNGVPVLRMGNIQRGELDLTNLKYLPPEHEEFPELLLKKDDLLFNRTNSAELVGKSAVYKGTPNPCSYASYLISVRLSSSCSPMFLNYYINSTYGRAM